MDKPRFYFCQILDRGSYNISAETKEAAKKYGIVLHHLPPYSPNLNPIERLWKVMNAFVRNHRVFKSASEFRQSIDDFFAKWPQIAHSMIDRINDNLLKNNYANVTFYVRFAYMIKRRIKKQLEELLRKNPALVLIGPRQVGKTTLALDIAHTWEGIYLDLELPSNLAKLTDIEEYCHLHSNQLLILDEIQHIPNLFAPIRGIIDVRRRQNKKTGQFLFLGSASLDLLKQTSETLAGRLAYCELFPLTITEVSSDDLYKLWCRGGFPESYMAENEADSMNWRLNFIQTYLERDIPQLGPRIPAATLRRFWMMLAHNQGQTFNAAAFAKGLDVKGVTTSRYLDLMVDLLLIRRLPSWESNHGKRLVKAPKTYVRDSGMCHALLGIKTLDDLLGHPVVGNSWEGFVIENIISVLPTSASCGYYRTVGGAEIDLVVDLGNNELWAIEIKRSTAPVVSKGFYSACDDLQPTKKFVVYAGNDRFPIAKDIDVLSLKDMLGEVETATARNE